MLGAPGWPQAAAVEQLPIPCTVCGAPMREQRLAEGSVLQCGYCGRNEPLPVDAQARSNFLHARLRDLSFAKARVTSLGKAVSQGWHQGLWSYGLVLLFIGGQSVFRLASGFDDLRSRFAVLPAEERAALLAQQVWWTIAPVVLVGSIAVAYLLSFAYARIKIRPLLLARAPSHPGQAMSCRCCGGALPPAQGAFVDCHYCGAQNLISGDMANRVALAWEREAAGYGLSMAQVTQQLQRAASPWIFWIMWGLCIGLSAIVPSILIAFL